MYQGMASFFSKEKTRGKKRKNESLLSDSLKHKSFLLHVILKDFHIS